MPLLNPRRACIYILYHTVIMWDLELSRRRLLKLRSCGILRRILWFIDTNVSKRHTAPIVRCEWRWMQYVPLNGW
jgi:hypothetical protein